MIGVFLFSYSFIPSLLQYTRKSSAAILLVNFIGAHVRITVVKMSNVFYLRLSWRKSLFQVVTKGTNNYRFLKIIFPLQTLT